MPNQTGLCGATLRVDKKEGSFKCNSFGFFVEPQFFPRKESPTLLPNQTAKYQYHRNSSAPLTLSQPWVDEIDYTAKVLTANNAYMYVLLKSDFNANPSQPVSSFNGFNPDFKFGWKEDAIHTALLQYGHPGFNVMDSNFENFNSSKTLTELRVHNLGVSLQAQVLAKNGLCRVYDIKDFNSPSRFNIVANFYDSLIESVSMCSGSADAQPDIIPVTATSMITSTELSNTYSSTQSTSSPTNTVSTASASLPPEESPVVPDETPDVLGSNVTSIVATSGQTSSEITSVIPTASLTTTMTSESEAVQSTFKVSSPTPSISLSAIDGIEPTYSSSSTSISVQVTETASPAQRNTTDTDAEPTYDEVDEEAVYYSSVYATLTYFPTETAQASPNQPQDTETADPNAASSGNTTALIGGASAAAVGGAAALVFFMKRRNSFRSTDVSDSGVISNSAATNPLYEQPGGVRTNALYSGSDLEV
jgi:hypothetical protein